MPGKGKAKTSTEFLPREEASTLIRISGGRSGGKESVGAGFYQLSIITPSGAHC